MMQILDTGIGPPQAHMEWDLEKLQAIDPKGDPILHLYEWEGNAATFGYFISPEKHLDIEKAKKYEIRLARRVTGGGIVFHLWDLAFSFFMPSGHPAFSLNTLENYRFVNSAVLEVMGKFLEAPLALTPEDTKVDGKECQNFCMAKPTRYDVVYRGMKIAGAAQRRTRSGFLHQGTISLAFPDLELLREVLLSKEEVVEAMRAYTFAPLGEKWTPGQLQETRKEVEKQLAKKLMEKLRPYG